MGPDDKLTLFLGGKYMVPPWEPLEIIEKGDTLRVTLTKGVGNSVKGRTTSDVSIIMLLYYYIIILFYTCIIISLYI